MYPCIKFQFIWRTSDFGTKFAQKYMNDKTFEKITIKIEIGMQQSTSVPDFSQFEELQILGLNLPKKDFRVEY